MLKTCVLFGLNVLTKGRIFSGFFCLTCLGECSVRFVFPFRLSALGILASTGSLLILQSVFLGSAVLHYDANSSCKFESYIPFTVVRMV